MGPFKLSANQLALKLHVPTGRITEIVNGDRTITPDTALRLAKFFGNTPQFWLNLQSQFDLQVAEDTLMDEIDNNVKPMVAQR
jgi:addiction module HigA family antidote